MKTLTNNLLGCRSNFERTENKNVFIIRRVKVLVLYNIRLISLKSYYNLNALKNQCFEKLRVIVCYIQLQ